MAIESAARSEDYLQACEIHDRIAALFPEVRRALAYRRGLTLAHRAVFPPGSPVRVNRDLIVLSLVTKAVTTHFAVRTLTDARLENDATALCRTLLENVILLEWLLRESYRLDLYALSHEFSVTRIAEATSRHSDSRPELKEESDSRAAKNSSLVRSVFGSERYQWAKSLSSDGARLERNVFIADMFDEVVNGAIPKPGTPRAPNFTREIPYSLGSWSVHSLPPSLQAIMNGRSRDPYFNLEVWRDADSALTPTLHSANIHALVAVSVLEQYAGLGFESEVDSIATLLKAQFSTVFIEP